MKAPRGFTLIELMVVVAIIGILAAIAIPGFNEQIRKSRRSEAITELQNWQLRFEKWRANNPSYANSVPADPNYPTKPGNTAYYSFADASGVSATGITLSTTAQGGQAADKAGGVSCTTLTIQIDGNAISKTPIACWK